MANTLMYTYSLTIDSPTLCAHDYRDKALLSITCVSRRCPLLASPRLVLCCDACACGVPTVCVTQVAGPLAPSARVDFGDTVPVRPITADTATQEEPFAIQHAGPWASGPYGLGVHCIDGHVTESGTVISPMMFEAGRGQDFDRVDEDSISPIGTSHVPFPALPPPSAQ
jgi:hypothetical protein